MSAGITVRASFSRTSSAVHAGCDPDLYVLTTRFSSPELVSVRLAITDESQRLVEARVMRPPTTTGVTGLRQVRKQACARTCARDAARPTETAAMSNARRDPRSPVRRSHQNRDLSRFAHRLWVVGPEILTISLQLAIWSAVAWPCCQ